MGLQEARPVKIFISAGEASGDLHGAWLARALRELLPAVEISCMGGPLLAEAGATVLVDNRELAVVGLVEVVRHLKVLYSGWQRIRSYLIRERPAVIVLIDFPDFNMLLARVARGLGIKVFYYISPQVWAWRSGRVRTLKRVVDRMVPILPFEPDYFARHGLRVDYLGHPLQDVLQSAPDADLSRALYRPQGATGPLVGLLPGSRKSELRLILPLLLASAGRILSRCPDVSFIIPVAPTLEAAPIEAALEECGLNARVVKGDSYGVIRACDLVLTASGTVTLETAILGTPMIITYRVSELSYRLGRRLVKVSHVGLPNLIAGKGIVPELLQHEATPDGIAEAALQLLNDPAALAAQRRELGRVSSLLGAPGVAGRVASLVLETCAAGPPGSGERGLNTL